MIDHDYEDWPDFPVSLVPPWPEVVVGEG